MKTWLERLFLALIFSLGFMQPALPVSGYQLPGTEFTFLIVAVVLAAAVTFKQVPVVWDPIYHYLIAFIIAMAASAAFSVRPEVSLVKLAGVVYLVGLTVICINVVTTERILKQTVLVWICASTIVCTIGVITIFLFYVDRSSPWHSLFLHHYGSLPVGNYPRIQSTFLYPAMLCNYLTVGLVLTLAAGRVGWLGHKTWITVAVLHCLCAAVTLTPGLGGFLFGLTAYAAAVPARSKKATSVRLSVAAGFTAVLSVLMSAISPWPIQTSPYVFSFFGTRLDPTQRLLAWQGSWDTFLDFPILGKGIGLGVANVQFLPPSGQMQLLTDAHNVWLSVAAQAGVVGTAALLAIAVTAIIRSRVDRSNSTTLATLRHSLLIAFVSVIFIQGLVGSFEDARHLWVLIGLIVAASKIDSEVVQVKSKL